MTKLCGMWALGPEKISKNGKRKRVKHRDKLRDVQVTKVAVEGPDLEMLGLDAPLKFTSGNWTLREALNLFDTEIWLCVLHEPAGDNRGKGFQRGWFWDPDPDRYWTVITNMLVTGNVSAISLGGNEFGIVAQGQERISRFTYLLGLAEALRDDFTVSYPEIDLILPGTHGLSHGAGLASYLDMKDTDNFLKEVYLLDYHSYKKSTEEIKSDLKALIAKGWTPVLGEDFEQVGQRALFPGNYAAALAATLDLKYYSCFTYFGEPVWGDSQNINTQDLGLIGVDGKISSFAFALYEDIVNTLSEDVTPDPDPPEDDWIEKYQEVTAEVLRLAKIGFDVEQGNTPQPTVPWQVEMGRWFKERGFQLGLGYVPGRGWRADALFGEDHRSTHPPVKDTGENFDGLYTVLGRVMNNQWSTNE